MATELGQAFVQIVPSARGISGSIEKVMNGEGANAGVSAGKSFAGKLKGIIAAAGIGAALKKTLSYGAELQQNLGGTEAVFGKHAESLQNTAKSAYKNMGLSASDYMATANKMGSLFQGSGVSQVKSLEMTEAAMQRAADVASVMGIDTTMAMESIAGAAKGNFTMMDNLGVAMNATTLEAYALEKGLNFKWNTASNAEKAELAMKMFMDRTSQYANNFAKESETTLSGSIGAMKAAYQDLMANLTLGQDVGPAMNNLVQTAVVALKNLIPAVGNILSSLPGAINTAMNALHPVILDGLRTATEAIKANAPKMIGNALKGLLNFSETLRGNAGELISAGLEMIESLADGIIQNIPTFIQTVPTIISNFAGIINDNAPKVLSAAFSIMKNLAVGLIKAIPVLIANLPKILKAMWDVFTAFQWTSLGSKIIEAIGNGLKAAFTALPQILSHAWELIKIACINAVASLASVLLAAWEGIKTVAVTAWNALKTSALTIWNSLKTAVMTPINALKAFLQSAWTVIQTVAAVAWNTIKTVISVPISLVRTIIQREIDGVKAIFRGITSVIGTVGSAFNNIKEAMQRPISEAREKIKGMMDKIKAIFPLKIGKIFSDIKLPKISVSGGKAPYGIGGKGSLPSFSVTWNKFGGVYDGASIVGIGVGEAGREIITPEDLMRQVMRQETEASNEKVYKVLLQILRYLSVMTEQEKSIVLNNREFARLVNEVL